jgi:hypothetical protein
MTSSRESLQNVNVPILDLRLQQFYQNIGRCIKAWATVEDKLFDICERVLKTDRHFVSVIFFRTPSIDSRLKLTNELLEAYFAKGHPALREWKPIRTKIDKLLPTRNSLAHHPVKMIIHPTDRSFETSTSEKERLRGKEPKRTKETELLHHLTETDAISQSLVSFISSWLG